MNKNLILSSNILDIVFENRNKEYGAYNLRKLYKSRLKISLAAMLSIAIFFLAFTLLPAKSDRIVTREYDIKGPELKKAEFPPLVPEKKAEIKKPDAQPLPKEIPVREQQFLSNIDIVDKKMKTDIIQTLFADTKVGSVTNLTPDVTLLVKPATTDVDKGSVGPAIPKIDKSVVMEGNEVEVLPMFPGGTEALIKFLKKNLVNPYDLENGETISVKIKFVVGYDGKLQKFEVAEDGGAIYNKEVIRVLKKMPDWTPGRAKGEDVSVYYIVPVKFTMSN